MIESDDKNAEEKDDKNGARSANNAKLGNASTNAEYARRRGNDDDDGEE